MTGGAGSDACARLAMARLRHSLCATHAGPFAGAPAPTVIGVCRTIVGAGVPASNEQKSLHGLYRQVLNRWFRVLICVVHRTVP
ncbi:hypothetical protein DM819_02505 [Pseudomonas hunanensis]|uniref:Uncharacterized protein n=1 Tax=Pseudomonas hunanensis TaxID=1247546 RepID=A0ABD6N9I1_9PSED|nr:hypothetical protein [Pseudomonas hunanensis]